MTTADHPACPLFEVDPQPKLYANVVGIEVIFLIGEEVVSRDGYEDMRINGKIVSDEPFEANAWPEDQGRIIFTEAGVDKFEPEVRARVGDRPALPDPPVGERVFVKP